jgi:alpha-tubulin suppressor-like RCC1 family protein
LKAIFRSTLVLLLLQAISIPAATVTNISAAADHSLFLESDGSLWAMGHNDSGQLGDGTTNNSYYREQIVSSGVIAVAAGDYHNLFLKSDGSLWGMGQNLLGQLGDGTYTNTNLPEQIVSNGVFAIAAGSMHSLFLKSDGSLWAMGRNLSGELGDGSYFVKTNQPQLIVSNGVTAIAASGLNSLFLKSDGSLWGTGDNTYGQLGIGTSGPSNQTNTPQQIVPGDVVAIAAGGLHNLFLKSDGSLWGMGYNGFGQLGDGTTISTNRPRQIISSNVVAIAAGGDNSFFIKSDGSLWAMGLDQYGELGDGHADPVYGYYTNNPEQIVPGQVIAIAAGGSHSLFLKSDASLWAMGLASSGQLGDTFNASGYYYASIPERIIPLAQPRLNAITIISRTNVQLNATCYFSDFYRVLTATNVTQPLFQWTPVRTNSVTARGSNNFSATLSDAFNPGTIERFYILQAQ